jgi:hypothetical protein
VNRPPQFDLYKSLMATVLTTIASLFIGAFADKVGLKVSSLWALSCYFVGDAIDYPNYTFLKELPLEFLYLDVIVTAIVNGYFLSLYGIMGRYVVPANLASSMAMWTVK